MEKRLFIVSNRLPVSISQDNQLLPASGGLVSAMISYLHGSSNHPFAEVFWAGAPCCEPGSWTKAAKDIHERQFTYLPVFVNSRLYEGYYNGHANSVLWPLFHYFPSYAEYNSDCYDHYMQVNVKFLQTLATQLHPHDTVWIHDYHLLPLAGLLRKAFPELSIGFFLHIPFPSYELMRLMPKQWQHDVLTGMLGADLIGFHTIDYAAHFLQSVQMVLGLEDDRHIIRTNDRLVKVDVFPISIDYLRFNSYYDDATVVNMRRLLRDGREEQKIIFSVDRLDYTKGVSNRLKAYERFLGQHPQYHGKVIFIMVIVPSRDMIPKYTERKKMIDEMISNINSKIGTIHWQPVIYQYNPLGFEDLLALYTTCDLALITPLRDGMNLVAKEFVASRKDEKGVLVLSEMAGSARELTDALIINPNDIEEMAAMIRLALEMPQEEQTTRIRRMQQRIKSYDVSTWAEDFLNELRNVKAKQKDFQVKFLDDYSKNQLVDSYRQAKNTLLLFDYDGTLIPFSADLKKATPSDQLLKILSTLSVGNNDTYLISGRSSDWLESHFGHLPLHMIAEHGARVRYKGKDWSTEMVLRSEWKIQVQQIMKKYERRCAHSFIEEKEFSMVWHYRNAIPEHGKLRASELMAELNDFSSNKYLQVVSGNKIVEIRNRGIDKGAATQKILAKKNYDFILAIGDDNTDEDMFKVLAGKKNSFTIKVGSDASFASYNLFTPQTVISLLELLAHITKSEAQGVHNRDEILNAAGG
jgi:trehalose 6-phosphate synthase/phosphatase